MKKFLLFLLLMLITPVYAANLDEMTGQMIITGFIGNNIKSKGFKTVLKQIETGKIGGVIFFEDNIKNKNDFIKMTTAIKNSKAKYTPLIAIDMEGGLVQRMNEANGFKNFKTAKAVSKLTEDEAYKEYFEMAKVLKDANINFNLAPCVDIEINKNSIIAKKERSFSDNPKIVVKYAKQFIKAHSDNKIATSIKHFPGHGNTDGDTHFNKVSVKHCIDEELYPYLELANISPLETIMVSHIYNNDLDDKYPASLSYKTINKLLRIQADFKGVIITDDLEMNAISKNYELYQIVPLAINSGENILLISNRKRPDENLPDKINLEIKQGLIDGTILPENIISSFNKIKELKKNLL